MVWITKNRHHAVQCDNINMKYIKLFLFLLVVFASTAYAPRAFAQVYLGGCINATASDGICPKVDLSDAGMYGYQCDQPPWDGVTGFTQYKLGISSEDSTIQDSNTTGIGLCNQSFNPHANIGSDPQYNGEEFVFLSLYSPNDATFYGYTVFQKISGDGTSGGDWRVLTEPELVLVDTTRIVAFIPELESTVATGTQTVGVTYYLNFDDWGEETATIYFDMTYPSQPLAVDDEVHSGPIPVTTFGYGTWSTTTNLQGIGPHFVSARLEYDPYVFGLFTHHVEDNGIFNVFASTTSLGNSWLDEFQAGFASTTAQISAVCNPFSSLFGIATCLSSLILPPGDVFVRVYDDFQTLPPWGYAFRFYDIASGNATTSTSTLPILTYTSPSNSIFGVSTFSFDPFGTLLQAGSIVNATSTSDNPQTVWEIFEPIITIIVYLMLLLMVLHDVGFLRRHNKIE